MLVPAAGGVREVPVEGDRVEGRVLDDRALAELHRGVLAAEAAIGRPADTEFCFEGGRLTWLQCRPMTALPTAATAVFH
jgi:phosphoenolpyruvate synthase/pyruvate phosphate dikinase